MSLLPLDAGPSKTSALLNLVKTLWIILLLGLPGILLLAHLLSLFEEPTMPLEERLEERSEARSDKLQVEIQAGNKAEIQAESLLNRQERELLDVIIRGLTQPLTASEERQLSIELLAGDGYPKYQLQEMSPNDLRELLIVEAMKME